MIKIDKLQAYGKIINTKGEIFTVTFTKKDGSERIMNCRTGVKKGIKGIGRKFNPIEKLLIGVYDVQKMVYRMINLQTIKLLHINKHKYIVMD